jgi:hypothetical protein
MPHEHAAERFPHRRIRRLSVALAGFGKVFLPNGRDVLKTHPLRKSDSAKAMDKLRHAHKKLTPGRVAHAVPCGPDKRQRRVQHIGTIDGADGGQRIDRRYGIEPHR